MKIMISLVSFLAASISFAYPKLGDTALFDGVFTNTANGAKAGFVQELKLTNFNANLNLFERTSTMLISGQDPIVQVDQIATDDLLSQIGVSDILSQCVANGGQIEDITVPAGEFKTCMLFAETEDESQIVWIGDVPFGFIKAIIQEKSGSNVTELQLRDFQHGKD